MPQSPSDVGVVAISAVPYSPERREETASTASIHACLKWCWRHYTSSSTRLRCDARRWVWTRICRTCWPRSRLEQLGCCCNNLAEASWHGFDSGTGRIGCCNGYRFFHATRNNWSYLIRAKWSSVNNEDCGLSRKANVDVEGKFSFPAASTVGLELEDEVVACCCSRETKAFFCPWLGSPLSVHWRRKLSVSLLPPLIEIGYRG